MRLRRFTTLTCFAALALLGCNGSSGDTSNPGGQGATPGGDTPAPKTSFENPGGMWMPTQMADHADTLKELGIDYDPNALTDPTAFPLGAVVSLGFCSGSFVSPEGLIVTNHHCAVPVALQYNSTKEKNLIKDGYLAKTKKDELWAGPNQKIYVTTAFTDVTGKVYAGTEGIAEPKARFDKIQENRKALDEACENPAEGKVCRIASYFEGAQYYQIEQLELRDIRLVYAPDMGVGKYGGEIDNWRWPRHTGDYSFLRAYVGKDGKPADYSEDNVPYQPPHHLKMASEPLQEGDLVMVAGYPGRTNRLKTAGEAARAADRYYPWAIQRYEEYIGLIEAKGKEKPEILVKYNRTLSGYNNGLTNNRGMLEGLVKGGLKETKAKEEAELKAWIEADEGRKAKYGGVLEQIDALNAKNDAFYDHDLALSDLSRASKLPGRASWLEQWAKEKDKKAKWDKVKAQIEASDRGLDLDMDRAMIRHALIRTARLPEDKRPKAFRLIVPKGDDEAAIDKALDKLYGKTKLGDAKAFTKMMEKATEKSIKKSKDPFVKLMAAVNEANEEVETRQKEFEGAMAALRPQYVAALKEFKGGVLAPDANSTLRVTYGTVRGYAPSPDKPVYTPFTTVSEMVAKHTGEEPFNAPQNVLDAAKAGNYGSYAPAELNGEMVLDFLADLDITGGNSGSACLNRKGELVGLAFDGNYEAMASDWIFMPEITRSIQVDFRYVMWIMDAADGADHLLEEMGVTPSIQ